MTLLAPSVKLFPPLQSWETCDHSYSRTTLNNDKNDIKAIIDASFRRNLTRAAGAIVSVLNEKGNEKLREEVTKAIKAIATWDDVISDIILPGVKGILTHIKSKTQRKVQGAMMMKHIAAACMFHVQKENASVRNSVLSKKLGISTHQLTLARESCKHDQQFLTWFCSYKEGKSWQSLIAVDEICISIPQRWQIHMGRY